MASTFSPNLSIELIGTGDQAGTWGTTTNSNLGTLIEQAISGYVTQAVATGTDTTITIPNGSTGVARNMYIELTGTGGASTNLIVPANKKLYFIFNNSTGAVTVKVSGQTGVSVPTGKKMVLVSNGTDIVNGLNYIADFGTNSFSVTNLTASSATITNLIATSGSITNLVSSDASATVLRAGSATLTHLSATSASITNLTLTSLVISNLSIASANITTLTGSTQTLSGNLTLNGGTANGVLYLNGSKVATSGSALTFDGTTLTTNTAAFQILGVISPASTAAFSSYVRPANNKNIYFREATAVGASLAGALIQGATNDAAGWAPLSFGATEYEWGTSGTERMRLDSSGNLGIGTSSPASALYVKRTSGNAGIYADYNGTNVGRLEAASNGNLYLGTTTGTGSVLVGTTANAAALELNNNGNLGLGVTPSAWSSDFGPVIQVKTGSGGGALTGSATDNFRMFSNTFYDGAYKRIGAGFATQYEQAVGRHIWSTAGTSTANSSITFTEVMRLDASGNLGIGTSSPVEKLDVVGNCKISSGSSFYWGDATSQIVADNGGAMRFLTGTAAERARITSAGEFLISTTTTTGNGKFSSNHDSASTAGASSARIWNQIKNVAASNNATVDVWLGRDAAGNVIGNNSLVGHFNVYVTGASGANGFAGVYSIITTGNGTSEATLSAVSTVTRGTSPVSSIQIAADGGSGAIKLTVTYINNAGVVTGGNSQVSFIGQII